MVSLDGSVVTNSALRFKSSAPHVMNNSKAAKAWTAEYTRCHVLATHNLAESVKAEKKGDYARARQLRATARAQVDQMHRLISMKPIGVNFKKPPVIK